MMLKSRLVNLRFELRGWRSWPMPANARRVLIYHGVTRTGDRRFNTRFVSAARLAADLAMLAAIPGLRFVPLDDLFDRPDAAGPRVAVTFDDGYRNFLTHALPVLSAAGVPATLYVTAIRAVRELAHARDFLPGGEHEPYLWADRLDLTAWEYPGPLTVAGDVFVQDSARQWRRQRDGVPLKRLCKTSPPGFLAELLAVLERHRCNGVSQTHLPADLADYWRLLDEGELARLGRHPLVRLGGHGVSHCNFSTLSRAEAAAELALGKSWLEGVSGQPVHDFAWPDGDYSPALADLAEQAGYRRQGLTDYARAEDVGDPRLINRLGVNPFISARAQRAIVAAGGYGHEAYAA
ncbi:polysaccharide deacetylase family protein [Niveispirillum sp. BGYR6]|uniref:polysaccharide deacetylase family protein n=1 Tax=Niveispirillum sp. BGYR6 TaxID=2971249 RepID=UPI0022B97921|nr:polysaccharide deacetylase family protein [Niveispirillum sp. BGYR6]MDG5497825.1 polysaccharide deacetylase family protein [Niveispirillum sp. BGYR6]